MLWKNWNKTLGDMFFFFFIEKIIHCTMHQAALHHTMPSWIIFLQKVFYFLDVPVDLGQELQCEFKDLIGSIFWRLYSKLDLFPKGMMLILCVVPVSDFRATFKILLDAWDMCYNCNERTMHWENVLRIKTPCDIHYSMQCIMNRVCSKIV